MARKKNTIPSGFDDILGNIYSNAEQSEGVSNVDDLLPPNTPLDDKDEQDPPVNTEDGKEEEKPAVETKDDDSDIPEDVINNTNTTNTEDVEEPEDNNEPSEADLIEAQQVGLLFDAIGQSFGWNMDDVKEEDRPLTVDELTQHLRDVVEQNSIPEYADDRVRQLDEYVKNGGKFEDFYSKQQEALSLDNIDIEDESNQKAVIRELLKYNNYSDEQISKKISRYEDADMLYEESEDALERLKTIRKNELEERTKLLEQYAAELEAKSKAFFESVTNDINSLTNIRGISIPKEDRKALFDYIFKVDQNGISQYQKDFNKNLSKNLIESAYFTMKADSLISTAKKSGETSAAEKLRKMLRHTTKDHSVFNADDKQKSVTDLLAGAF